jgi:hypothetical protein
MTLRRAFGFRQSFASSTAIRPEDVAYRMYRCALEVLAGIESGYILFSYLI